MYLLTKKPIIVLGPSRPITININIHPTPIADFAMLSRVARSGSLKGGEPPLGGAKANPNGDLEC